MEDESFSGAVADISKFFDQIRRRLVYRMLRTAGMPEPIQKAYENYVEGLQMYNCLAGGIGSPYRRRRGIPQGCPLSMMIVAMLMRPWIVLMRSIECTRCYILADDVLILATGGNMLSAAAEAISATHKYLAALGAKVAPDKSFNFATTAKGRKWLSETWWEEERGEVRRNEDGGCRCWV